MAGCASGASTCARWHSPGRWRDSAASTSCSDTSSTTRRDSRRAPDSSASRWRSSDATTLPGSSLAALLFATISQGGLAVNALVPKQMVEVLHGRRDHRRRHHGAGSPAPPARGAAEKRGVIVLVFLAQTLRIAMPYLFAASGGVLSERSGVIALTLEGWMLSGAFSAAVGSYYVALPVDRSPGGVAGGVLSRRHSRGRRRSASGPTRSSSASRSTCWRSAPPASSCGCAFDSSSNSPRVPGFDCTG